MSSVRDVADQDTLHSGPSALEVHLHLFALTLLAIADIFAFLDFTEKHI